MNPNATFSLDLNCDLGEGLPIDPLLMPYLNSCNIACGGHAGDEASIRKSLLLAKKHDVKIGAHPSYPDQRNFGRVAMKISMADLHESLIYQLNSFKILAEEIDCTIHHVKPHGALYNQAGKDEETSEVIIKAVLEIMPEAILYCAPNSVLEQMAMKSQINVWSEVFADRNYLEDLSLVPRTHPDAVMYDPDEVIEHLRIILNDSAIRTLKGNMHPIDAHTVCIHGDNPKALEILKKIRSTQF